MAHNKTVLCYNICYSICFIHVGEQGVLLLEMIPSDTGSFILHDTPLILVTPLPGLGLALAGQMCCNKSWSNWKWPV